MGQDAAGLVVRCLVAAVCFLGMGTAWAQALLSQGGLTPEGFRPQGVGGQEAGVPRVMQYGGVLQDALGRPLVGVQGVTFALYREQTGGSPLWLETQNVTADAEGRFAVLLGATKSEGLPLDLFASGESRWLGVQANQPGEAEQPRVLLVSVPYALNAANAETLGGKPVSAFLLSDPNGDREAPPDQDGLPQASASEGLPTAAAGTPSTLAMFDADGTTLINSGLTQSGSNVSLNSGFFGLGTSTPGARLHVVPSGPQIFFMDRRGTGTGNAEQWHLAVSHASGGDVVALGQTSFNYLTGSPLMPWAGNANAYLY